MVVCPVTKVNGKIIVDNFPSFIYGLLVDNKANFQKYMTLAVASRYLGDAQREIEHSLDAKVIAHIHQFVPEHWKENRHFRIFYTWEENGIEVTYERPNESFFNSMEEEPETRVWFRLTYSAVFGWTMDWKKSVSGLTEAKKIVSEVIEQKCK